jgi:hypothetical protein
MIELLKKYYKAILGASLLIASCSTIYAFADDFLYTQAEANIKIAQDNKRVCDEDGALLIVLEAQYPPGSTIPPHVARRMQQLRESVARTCVKRG